MQLMYERVHIHLFLRQKQWIS